MVVGTPVHAQKAGSYPERPIRVVVPFPAGGAIDNIARTTMLDFAKALDAQTVIDNRSGAGGALGTEFVARAAPDGYTLLVSSTSPMAINPHINKVGYDPLTGFSPVGMIARSPQMLVVPPSLPVRSVKEFVALAKAKPGALSFASSGVGTIIHVTAELFAQQAGIKLLHVPYKGAAPATIDTITGQVTMLFAAYSSVAAHVRAGKLKALALTSAKRMAIAPDLPTIAESGLPGFESTQWWAISGPAGLAPEIVARLNGGLDKVLATESMKKRLAAEGAEAVPGSPSNLAGYIRTDFEKWGRVIRSVGLKAQ
jgi:tripartite-type tricarboxylate transporter receptor subunit TctC